MDIFERARAILLKHRRKGGTHIYIAPGEGRYPEQFFWDSGFHVLATSTFDQRLALEEILSLLEAQWSNGFIPHTIYWNLKRREGWLSTLLQNMFLSKLYGTSNIPVPCSRFTGSPVPAIALSRVKDVPPAVMKKIVLRFIKYYHWLGMERDIDHDGIYEIYHPWENGLDDAVAFDNVFPLYFPSSTVAYAWHHFWLVQYYARLSWDPRKMHAVDRFVVEDVMFNSLALYGLKNLAWLAKRLSIPEWRDLADEYFSRLESFISKHWFSSHGLFFNIHGRNDIVDIVNTAITFAPLLLDIPENIVDRLVYDHLLNQREYWQGDIVNFPVPTVSASESKFSPGGFMYHFRGKHWRGPVWMPMNWVIIRGLLNHGKRKIALSLYRRTLGLISHAGDFYEKFDPITGEGLGHHPQSWTCAILAARSEFSIRPPIL